MNIQFSKTKEKMDMGEGSRVEVDLVDILKETEGIESFYGELGERVPAELYAQLAELKKNLNK